MQTSYHVQATLYKLHFDKKNYVTDILRHYPKTKYSGEKKSKSISKDTSILTTII